MKCRRWRGRRVFHVEIPDGRILPFHALIIARLQIGRSGYNVQMSALPVFLLLMLLAALPGWRLLRLFEVESEEAWALGRVLGPVVVVFPAWWAGALGLRSWPFVAGILLAVGSVWTLPVLMRERPWREIGRSEGVFWLFSFLVLFFRAGSPAIEQTEKFMDMGIFSTLLRTQGFPPPDFWLAGKSLPYYYWGALPWATALRGSGLEIGWAYNIIVALLAGATALLLFSLGRRLSGSSGGGWMAAFFGLMAGTPDGLRQILAGIDPRHLDLWASSRQIEGAITEFPLFSFWLGDLHPHVLSMPLSLSAIALAAIAGARKSPILLLPTALFFGLSWAANPWSMPPTLAGVALMLLVGDGRWHWPGREGRERWLQVGAVALGGALLSLPFHLNFHPPSHPIRPVFAWTPPVDLLLYGGIFLLPLCLGIVRLVLSWGDRRKMWALIVAGAGGAMLLGVAAGRPLVPILSLLLAILVAQLLEPGVSEERPALALAMLALFLLLVPELVYVQDGYGAEMHRMNTIFKAYIQAWPLFALALSVLLRLAMPSFRKQNILLVALLVLALPHPVSLSMQSLARVHEWGLDGLDWMSPRDRGLVGELRRLPPGRTMIEAVGGAYSEYGRLSAASGVPSYLGWANHEMVWRGTSINGETAGRKARVEAIYTATDSDILRRELRAAGVDVVAFGDLEARDFGEKALAILSEAGDHQLKCRGGGVLVFFDHPEEKP